MNTYKATFFLIIILFSSNFIKGQIQDAFFMDGSYVSGSILLKQNGDFEIKIKGKRNSILNKYSLHVIGQYELNNSNSLKLNPNQISETNKKGNTSKDISRIDEISKQASIEGFYSIVEYLDTKLLLSHSNAYRLSTLINKERKQVLLPNYIFRNKENFKSFHINIDIKENYPKWQKEYILDSPIYCQYIDSEKIWHFSNGSYTTFPKHLSIFNKGKSDGLLPGMWLYKNDSGYIPGCDVRIETVTDSTAKAIANPNLNGNDKCRTGTYSTFINPIAAEETPSYTIHVHNAEFYFEEKKYQKSLARYEQAFQEYDKNGMDYFIAGILACQLGNNKKAKQYIIKAIENNFFDEDRLHSEYSLESLRRSKYWNGLPDLMKREKDSYKQKFNKIKDVPFVDLIPFKRKNLWGFISKKTSEVLIQAEFEKVTFGVECLKLKIADRNEIQIYPNLTIKQYYQKSQKYYSYKKPFYPEIVDNLPDGGFITNDSCIAFVSNIYDRTSYSFDDKKFDNVINIQGPFLIKGKEYGVVSKNKKMGLIDSKGNALEYFNFNFFKLIRVSLFKGEGNWFYFEDFSNNHGFINQRGEKRFVNMFDNYPFTSKNRAGYGVLRKRNSVSNFQIIDFHSMKLLHQNLDYQFIRLHLQLKECNRTMDYGERDNLQELFCLVKDKNGNQFYIGESGGIYSEKQ